MEKSLENFSKAKYKPTPFRADKPTTAICSCCARHIPVRTRLKIEDQGPNKHLTPLTFDYKDDTFVVLPQIVEGTSVTEDNKEVFCYCGATFTHVMILKVKDINILVLI